MNCVLVTAPLYVNAKPETSIKNRTITYGIVHRANRLAMCLIKFMFLGLCVCCEYGYLLSSIIRLSNAGTAEQAKEPTYLSPSKM